jgi:sigma-E factor negative regulatory protein RseA
MSEKMRESLSALMDDEANELEIQRLVTQIDNDPALRQTWRRYNLARQAMSEQSALTIVDISGRVRQEIDKEQSTGSAAPGLRQRLLRPLGSFAVAASVAATVVIGGQQIASLGGLDPHSSSAQSVAASASPVGLVNSLGATTVQASYGTRAVPVLQPATRTAYRELARQRMERYMQEHAEQAALNTPQGLIPFARVTEIRE